MNWPMTPAPANPVAEVDFWAEMLSEYSLPQVIAAMKSMATREYPPSASQVGEAIDPTPTYAAALEEFRRMLRRGYSSHRWAEVPWSHPLIAAFAESHFAEWGQSPDGTSDPALVQSEAAFRAHMRESFGAVARRYTAGELTTGEYGLRPIEEGGHGDHHLQIVRGTRTLGGERADGEAHAAEPDPDHA
jgi:hypothetical protein